MQVTRIQYPIGQGCFHTGRVGPLEGAVHEANAFQYVYDCGSGNQQALGTAIETYKAQTSRVDALFVSHFDNDHVNGLDLLLSAVKVDTVYIPYVDDVVLVLDLIEAELDGALSGSLIEASIEPQSWFGRRGVEHVVRVWESPGDGSPAADGDWDGEGPDRPRSSSKGDPTSRDQHGPEASGTRPEPILVNSGHRVQIPDQGQGLNWILVPHVDPAPLERRRRFETAMRKALRLKPGQPLTSARLADAMRDRAERERLRECYDTIVFRGTRRMHNRVSMSLYSGPAGQGNGQTWWHEVSGRPLACPVRPFGVGPFPFWSCEKEAAGWIGTGDATLGVKKVRKAWHGTLSLPLIPSGAETLVFKAPQRLASPVAPKDVQAMTRRDDLELPHGATAKARENSVKQGRVQATNTIGITRKGLDFYAG